MNILRSESTGSIHVTSTSPNSPPAVRFNFLSAQLDREVTLEAMRITRRIMTASPMRDIASDEMAPGVNIQSDDELLDWVRNNAETTYHPVGTCKMGSDPMAVVDDQLRVRGIWGLRVADASIMPTLTSGNTNAPSIMIGEKASRMILAQKGLTGAASTIGGGNRWSRHHSRAPGRIHLLPRRRVARHRLGDRAAFSGTAAAEWSLTRRPWRKTPPIDETSRAARSPAVSMPA